MRSATWQIIHFLHRNGKEAMRHSNKGRGRILDIDYHQQRSMLLVNTITACNAGA